jgi:hypothetical protein
MTAYARVAKGRNGTDWVVSTNTATLGTIATFPAMAGGAGGTVTHFGLGPEAIGGANDLVFFGAVTPNISVVAGVTPKLDTTTVITQAASDAMTTAAANKFLLLFFNNTDWAVVGDAAGLQNSSAAGSLYLSLHTASPAESGNQSTNEISYT